MPTTKGLDSGVPDELCVPRRSGLLPRAQPNTISGEVTDHRT